MAREIDLSKLWQKVLGYFKSLDTMEIVAWSAIGVGIVLIILGLVL